MQPTLKGQVLGLLFPHEDFKVLGERGGWVEVADRTSGMTGWASGTLVHRAARASGCP